MPRFEVDKVLKVLQNVPITTLCAPPTLYRSLIRNENLREMKNLRHCVSAGEPLNEEVIKTWNEKTGIWIREGYGQTETTLVAANFKGFTSVKNENYIFISVTARVKFSKKNF